jgi:hypothetical protein
LLMKIRVKRKIQATVRLALLWLTQANLHVQMITESVSKVFARTPENAYTLTTRMMRPLTASSDKYWNEYIYTSQSEAILELNRRRSDPLLLKQIQEFWGEHFPSFIDEAKPFGFFSRPVITPNIETLFFLDIVGDFHVSPILLEFPDTFTARNEAKYHAAKIHTFERSKKGHLILQKKSIIDFHHWEGKPINKIVLPSGINFCDYHHDLFNAVYPNSVPAIVDISEWFNKLRMEFSSYYYLGYLALSIYHGVIFENFLLDEMEEKEFFLKKVAPSFIKLEEIFGVKPLISPVLPLKNARLNEWYYYPAR